jgi:hypothetical protein
MALAMAPPPPEPKPEGEKRTNTTDTIKPVRGTLAYEVWRRHTPGSRWESTGRVVYENCHNPSGCLMDRPIKVVLQGTRVDDWVFGVSTSGTNWESPVASAVPGVAFTPYVAPPPAPATR